MNSRSVLLTYFLLLFFMAKSQQYGAFPPSTRWKQIDTDTARIIFTPGTEDAAQRVAGIIHRMAQQASPLGNALSKINVVLHSHTTLANGYVGLAPFRSEYYLVPGGNIFEFGNLPWTDQLAVHEYRHVQQYNNFNRGVSRALGVLFGQEGRALANALTIPDWFFEGDAVYAETALTPQGRGRMPFFVNGYKALWQEGREYNWLKLRNGSLKDYVPNHYPLGYLLTNYGYMKYGTDFWRKVTEDASSFRHLVYPFQSAIKKYSGVSYKTFRKDAYLYYRHEVSRNRDQRTTKETFTNYHYPQAIGKDSLLYMKDGFKNIPAFFVRDAAGEHKVALRSISSEDWFSYRNGKIAYTAYSTNARWSLIDHSDIVLLDLHTGKEERISDRLHKQDDPEYPAPGRKYFTPDLSVTGDSIIAVFINEQLQSELHLISKGNILTHAAPEKDALFVHPRFLDAENILTGIRWPDATMTLEKFNLSSGKRDVLITKTRSTVGFPFVQRDTVYFVSSLSGNDDIYALTLKDKKMFQLTTGQTGHYFPSVYEDTLTWSDFTTNGYRVRRMGLNQLLWAPINPIQLNEVVTPLPVKTEETANLLAPAARVFNESVYRKGTGLFNFHSWRPEYTDPEFSLTLYGNNVLNTFSSALYYRYNQNENAHTGGLAFGYGGFFPQLTTAVEYTFSRDINLSGRTFKVDEATALLGYSIPLDLTKGKTARFLNFGSNVVLKQLLPENILKDSFQKETVPYLHHFISWTQQLPRARQQIFPRFGYTMNASARHRLDHSGYQMLGNVNLFLPTPFRTHSLQLGGSFQRTGDSISFFKNSQVIFANRFPNSRGYADFYFAKMWRASANYHLPLLYPDRGIGSIVYFLRVRGNLFYDFTRSTPRTGILRYNFRTTGGEMFFDTKWWNQLPVTFGVRYSYLLDADLVRAASPHVFELIVPMNLIPD